MESTKILVQQAYRLTAMEKKRCHVSPDGNGWQFSATNRKQGYLYHVYQWW
jgi:hypothetical protein